MSRTPMFLELSARPGSPDAVKTADDIIAENSRLRDLVRKMLPAVEEAFYAAQKIGKTIKGLCALKGVDASSVDAMLNHWSAVIREAREALGEAAP